MSFNVTGTGAIASVGKLIGDPDTNDGALSRGMLTKTITDADYTLTEEEAGNLYLSIAGTLTSGRNIVVPTVAGVPYHVFNNGTGQTLTFKTTSGTGIAVANNKRAILMVDGTNVVRMTADV